MRRVLGPLLTVILVVGVGVALYSSFRGQLSARQTVTVRGLIGSEKEAFFEDEAVQRIFKDNGLNVVTEKAGSRQIATDYDLGQYDFAFPAGVPAAEKIRRDQNTNKVYTPFFTPMVVASWQAIAEILVANGLAVAQDDYYFLDMEKLLELVSQETRWNQLLDNTEYDVNKRILISSTDVRKSNSAAMYLSLASYLDNGDRVVQNDADINNVLPFVTSLFLSQGFVEYSSAAPFEDYLVIGMGKSPLVMIYESQFIERAALKQGGVRPEMVLLYPQPTIFTKHVLVALSDGGARLGALLENDPELQRLATRYGFRNGNTDAFNAFVTEHHIGVAQTLVDVIEPPSYEIVERMITQIEARYP